MKTFLAFGIVVGAAVVFLLGIPPFSDIARHYFESIHPVARQLKVARTVSEGANLYAVAAAIELGIFDALKQNGPLSIDELAIKIESSPRGVHALVDHLCQADYLYSLGDGRYTNSQTSLHHLTSDVPVSADMKPVLQLFSTKHMSELSLSIAGAVRNGGSVKADNHAEQFDHPFWLHFSKVTGNMAHTSAADVTSKCSFAIGSKVLDVASGSGEYGFGVLQEFPKSEVTFQDYPTVLEQVKSNAYRRGVEAIKSDRADFIPGSFFEVDINSKFDTVIASNILHHFSVNTSNIFLSKANTLLNVGGYVIIVDICPSDAPYSLLEGSSMPRSFSLTMLTWSKDGAAYSVNALSDMLVATGFENIQTFSSFPFSTIIVAQKK
jgi:2-polyprenyl-3-methyl-5-hydroxy-6-metoxy-1,4-benzoquinol methylase